MTGGREPLSQPRTRRGARRHLSHSISGRRAHFVADEIPLGIASGTDARQGRDPARGSREADGPARRATPAS